MHSFMCAQPMNRWTMDDVIQDKGFEVLIVVIKKHIAIDIMVQHHGVQAIIRVMDAHREDVKIQCAACTALSITATNDTNRAEIASNGGIDSVLCAMEHEQDDLQTCALASLVNLALFCDNRDVLRRAGVVVRIKAAMENFNGNAGVQENCCRLLCNICDNNAENTRIVCDRETGMYCRIDGQVNVRSHHTGNGK